MLEKVVGDNQMIMDADNLKCRDLMPANRSCYTAGELAKLAGVSSRTIRFYDQKGILKPVDYSDGRYRLYDESSLLQLQKIIMLKYADFSLEEIERIIEEDKQTSLQDILWKQKLLLMQKRERLDGVISALDHVIAGCSEEDADWEKIVELMQLTNREEAYGKRFDFYEKYSYTGRYTWKLYSIAKMRGVFRGEKD